MIEAAMFWNEPNNKSHWDRELDLDWSIFADTVTRAGRAVAAINPAVIGMGGRLVVAGYHQDGPRQVNMQDWNWKGIDVVNAHERDPAVHRQGLREAVAAAVADRQLGVDLSYRFTDGMAAIADLVRRGALGRVFAIDLVFHNAYGPDKPWFYDRAQSGGGCVMDLGIHLVDLALWATGFPDIARTQASLFAGGAPLHGRDAVEDYAVATLDLADGTVVRLACSWRVHAGRDAVIEASFYGTEGGGARRCAMSMAPSMISSPNGIAARRVSVWPARRRNGAAGRRSTGRGAWRRAKASIPQRGTSSRRRRRSTGSMPPQGREPRAAFR